jgi:hypothetical protein
MVIAERFAWAHLPKTGGDAAAAMFAAVPGLVLFADARDSEHKHMPFFGREREIDGKLRVMNIRRLPAWALSGAHHKAAHGIYPEYRPLPLETGEQVSSRTDADDLLRWMTDHHRLPVDRWLRMETLLADMLALLSELGVIGDGVESKIRAVGRVNVGEYDRELTHFFTKAQIERLYELNPVWAAAERRAYGDLLLP